MVGEVLTVEHMIATQLYMCAPKGEYHGIRQQHSRCIKERKALPIVHICSQNGVLLALTEVTICFDNVVNITEFILFFPQFIIQKVGLFSLGNLLCTEA